MFSVRKWIRTRLRRPARIAVTLGLLLGGMAALGVAAAAPALADTQLCGGAAYSACINDGYSDHGYGEQSDWSTQSYWGAYPGHNCTNYVAYVETTVNSAPNPGNGLGDAYQWAKAAAVEGIPVNSTPAIGAVAQWNSDAGGVSSDGHVAYVESVNSNGSITVSEDSYPYAQEPDGFFDWRTISAGSADWPSNFIHFKDLAPPPPPPSLPTTQADLAWYDGATLWGFQGPGYGTVADVVGYAPPEWAGAGDYEISGVETQGIFWYDSHSTSIYFIAGPSFASAMLVRGPGVGAPVWAGVGDFTGDGYPDSIAWYDGTNLYLFAGSGLPTIWQTAGYTTPQWAGVGDFYHNGRDDLFWYLNIPGNAGSIYVLPSTGSGFSGAQLIRGPGVGSPVWAGVGNFSGDGYRDSLAWYDGTTLWTFEGPQLATTGSIVGYTAPQWAGVGECAGGTRDGLFWYQNTTIYCIGDNGSGFTGATALRGPGIGAPVWAASGNFGF